MLRLRVVSPGRVEKNIVANAVGQIWAGIIQLCVVPAYLSLLGVDAFGLLGFFLSLQAVLNVLDLGLSTTANREVAKRQAQPELRPRTRDTLRTLEVVYAGMAFLIAVGFIVASPWIGSGWFKTTVISSATLVQAVILFGATVAFRWPVSLYVGVLRGMERQTLINGIGAIVNTLRNLGGILVLVLVSPSLLLLLFWQLAVGVLEVVWLAKKAWQSLSGPGDHPARFKKEVLADVRSFAVGVGFITLFATVLKQSDRFLIGTMLSLEQLGFYQTAQAAVAALHLCSGPVCQAVFPRLSLLHQRNDVRELARVYHLSTQLIMGCAVPCACVLLFFPRESFLERFFSFGLIRRVYRCMRARFSGCWRWLAFLIPLCKCHSWCNWLQGLRGSRYGITVFRPFSWRRVSSFW
jgi:O-antigen/teichoic acid export membrane protein